MIKVEIREDGDGVPRSFLVRGHAGYRERGKDIVCAAVSALTQAAALGLQSYCGEKVSVRSAAGEMELRLNLLTPAEREKAIPILETMYLGLREVEKQYGRYLRVTRHSIRLPGLPKQ